MIHQAGKLLFGGAPDWQGAWASFHMSQAGSYLTAFIRMYSTGQGCSTVASGCWFMSLPHLAIALAWQDAIAVRTAITTCLATGEQAPLAGLGWLAAHAAPPGSSTCNRKLREVKCGVGCTLLRWDLGRSGSSCSGYLPRLYNRHPTPCPTYPSFYFLFHFDLL